jgi:intracellular sulfur oxidation DsrE/DsrF family protein
MKMTTAAGLALLASLSLGAIPVQAAGKPDDAKALEGVEQGRVVFDINISEPKKLPLYLMVIDETISDLERQGVKPEVILAFRGKAVTLVSTDREAIELTDLEHLEKAAAQLEALQKRGVRMEACSVATRLFGVDNATLLPGIEPVGNTFVSLIGYQAQGYATIPVY